MSGGAVDGTTIRSVGVSVDVSVDVGAGAAMGVTNCLIAGVGGQGTILAARVIGLAAMSRGMDVRGSETIGMAQRGGSVVSHVRMGRVDRAGGGTALRVHSPLVSPGEADVIVAFEPFEGARVARFLAPGGLMVVCDRALVPPGQSAAAASAAATAAAVAARSAAAAGAAAATATAARSVTAAGGSAINQPATQAAGPAIAWLRAAVSRLAIVDGDALAESCGARFMNVALLGAALAAGAFPFGADALEEAVSARVPPRLLEANLRALRYGQESYSMEG